MSGVTPWERGEGDHGKVRPGVEETPDDELIPVEKEENEEADEELVPTEGLGEGGGGDELIELEGGSEADLIDTYLARVGEHLKKSLRWDKDVILTKIREDILKKVENEVDRDRHRSIMEKNDSILVVRKVLNGYGDPRTIAGQYDGVGPRLFMARLVLPTLLIIDLLLLRHMIRPMWDSFEFISVWNTGASYVILGMVLGLAISISGFTVIRNRRAILFGKIRNEVRTFSIVGMIFLTSISGALWSDTIALTDDWESGGDGWENDPIDGSRPFEAILDRRLLIHDGIPYTHELRREAEGYSLLLHQWDRNLTTLTRTEAIGISFPENITKSLEIDDIETSGEYIHIWFRYRYQTYLGANKFYERIAYLFTTFSGKGTKLHVIDPLWFGYSDYYRLLVDGSTATICHYRRIPNENYTSGSQDDQGQVPIEHSGIELVLHTFISGSLFSTEPVHATVPFTGVKPGYELGPYLSLIPASGSITVLIELRYSYLRPDGLPSSSSYEETYFSRVSLNGSVLFPLQVVYISQRIYDDEYYLFGNYSNFGPYFGFGDGIVLYNSMFGPDLDETKMVHLYIGRNATTDVLEPVFTEFARYGRENVRIYNPNGYLEPDGTIRTSSVIRTKMGSVEGFEIFQYAISGNGSIHLEGSMVLRGEDVASDLMKVVEEDDDLYLTYYFNNHFFEGSWTCLWFSVTLSEERGYRDWEYTNNDIVIVVNDGEISAFRFGTEIRSAESKDRLIISIIIGTLIGIAFTYSLWDLGKKRMAVQN